MRLAGTALICVLAAFGAAFLVTRAANGSGGAPRPQTTPATVAANVAQTSTTTTVDHELVAQFAPVPTKLKPKRRTRHHSPTPASTPSQPQTLTTSTTQATSATPVQSPPASTSSSHHSGGSGSSGGSGTTTIGGN
jgi:hypothetical protein